MTTLPPRRFRSHTSQPFYDSSQPVRINALCILQRWSLRRTALSHTHTHTLSLSDTHTGFRALSLSRSLSRALSLTHTRSLSLSSRRTALAREQIAQRMHVSHDTAYQFHQYFGKGPSPRRTYACLITYSPPTVAGRRWRASR